MAGMKGLNLSQNLTSSHTTHNTNTHKYLWSAIKLIGAISPYTAREGFPNRLHPLSGQTPYIPDVSMHCL